MNKIIVVIFLSILFLVDGYGQSIYLEKKQFGLDFGFGYSSNSFDESEDDFNNYILNLSGSVFSMIDIGFQYSSDVKLSKIKPTTSYSVDLHFSKDPIGVAINTAFSNHNNHSNLLIGLSLYKIIKGENSYFLNKTIPIISVGAILPNNLVYSLSVSFQHDLSDNIKVAFTPGLNTNETITQLFFGIEFIVY